MKTIAQLNAEIKIRMDKLEEIKEAATREERHMTDDECELFETLMNEVDRFRTYVAIQQREDELRMELQKSEKDPPRIDPGSGHTPPDPEKEFRSFGEQLHAVIQAGSPGGPMDPRLARAASGLGEGVPSEGGFLIQPDFAADLIKRTYETGQVVSKCLKIPVSGNSLKVNAVDETSRATGSRWGGIQGYWAAEGEAKTKSKPKFRQLDLSLKKLVGLCYATDELLEDATALEAVIKQGFAEEFGFLLDDAVIRGTGAGVPLGVLNSGCLVTVTKETGQAAKTIQVENIVNMWSRLYAKSWTKSNWYINQDVIPQLFTMGITIGTGGAPIYMPPGGLSQSPYSTLLGRPVIPIEQCETLGTKGDIMLADFGEYILIDKGGIKQAQSIHVRFLYDETTFRFVYRVDGQPIWNSALTPYKGTNTVSPFITLQART